MQIDLIPIGQKISRIFPWVAIIILAAMLFQQCETNTVLVNNLKIEKSTTKYYKNQLGTVTASNEVLQFDKEQLENLVISKDDSMKKLAAEFSKIQSIIKYKIITKIDSVNIPFEVKAPCDFTRTGDYNHEWFNLGYIVDQNGITFEPLETWTDVTTITGFKKKWFWGKQTYTTDITPSNPLIYVQNVKSVEMKVPVRWYETTLFKVTAGAVAGYLIAK